MLISSLFQSDITFENKEFWKATALGSHLNYAPCLVCWVFFGSLAPAVCNRTSCAQVHVLTQRHCGDNQEGTSFSWLHIYKER